MNSFSTRIALAIVGCGIAGGAEAQIARKDLSIDTALVIAKTAMADCKAKGFAVSVAVVGRNGELLV